MNNKKISTDRRVILENIAQNCKQKRESKGLTLYQMAKIVGVTPQALHSFEQGKNDSATIVYFYSVML